MRLCCYHPQRFGGNSLSNLENTGSIRKGSPRRSWSSLLKKYDSNTMSDVITNEGHFLRKLQPIEHNDIGSSDWPEVRLIVVPDASSSQATHLSDSSWAWLSPVSREARVRAHYYEFQYNPVSKDATVWQNLNDGGDVLLSFLLQLDQKVESQAAVILISNGLGGLLAKKALTRLSERYFDPAARGFSYKLTQVIFIGCPHPTIDNKDSWHLLENVLKHDRKMGSKLRRAAAEEAGIVANLCSKFQEAGIQYPVMTTYESEPTRIRINILKSEKHILISNEFAETGARNEELIPLNLENHNMRALGTDPESKEFTILVRSCLAEANSKIRPNTPHGQGNLDPGVFKGSPFTMTASEETHSIAPHPPPILSSQPARATRGDLTNRSIGSADSNCEGRGWARLPCYIFGRHPRNPDFFGRSDILNQIDDSLLPRESKDPNDPRTLHSFAICGTGGMGKTQITLEYAYSRKDKFDAIFWITADTKTSIAESFSTIALSLGIATEAEVTDLTVSFSIVMRWLSNPTKLVTRPGGEERGVEASWLLIFDNADTIDLMSEFWPSTGIGSVLVTTRDPAGKDYCLGKGISLQPLPGPEALKFFELQLEKDTETEHHIDANFVEKFYGLPLAIVQVASLIRRRQMTTTEFTEAYNSGIDQSGLQDFQVSQHDGNYRHSIFTVWAFESLDETTQALLNVMSLLDPFHMQEFILSQDKLDFPGNPYPNGKLEYVNSRSSLVKASLITRSVPTEHIEIHPLVQEVLQARMSEQDLITHFSVAVTLIHISWPREKVKWHHETSHREQSAQMLAHALRLRTVYEKSLIDKTLSKETEDTWFEVLRESGWYLYERGEHEISLPIFLLASKLARKRSHERLDLLADILMCLSALGIHTCSPQQVFEYAREHLDLRQQVYDSHAKNGDVPLRAQYDRAMGVATMALAYNVIGEFEKAIPYAKDSLELYYSFPMYRDGKDVPYFAVAHMGWALWSLGRHEDARQLLMEAVEVDRRREAGRSYGLAGVLLVLGNVFTSLGRFSEAASTYEETVTIFYAANGDNYKTAQARLKHAEHLARAGREDEARLQFQLSIDAFARNPYYKPELARAQIKAARFLFSIGDIPKGQEIMEIAQSTLDKTSIKAKASEMNEEDMNNMVRMWSR